jgi:two-component system, cell cycle sensor histidine kinase and response regulator CckA
MIRRHADAYAQLAGSKVIAVLFWDSTGNITDASDGFLEMVGHSRADLQAGAVRWVDMTPEECRAADADAVDEIVAHGTHRPYEKQYLRKDGTCVSVLLAAAGLRQSPDGGMTFAIDLTGRKRTGEDERRSDAATRAILETALDGERKAQDAVHRERQRLSALSRDVGVAFTECDTLESLLRACPQLMVTHLNAALARIWTPNPHEDGFELFASAGCVAESGRPAGAATPMFFDAADIARDRRTIVSDTVIGDPRIDQEWASANHIVSFVGSPLIVGDRVVGVFTMYGRAPVSDEGVQGLSDIAHALASAIDRTRVETSQARLAAIVEATPDLVAMRVHGEDRPLYMNQGGRTMLGLDAGEELVDIDRLRTAEDRVALRDVILPAAIRDGQWSGESSYLHRDGRVIPVSQVMIARSAPDGTIQLSTIARDITGHKRIEEELRATNERTRFVHKAAAIGIWEIELDTGHLTWSDTLYPMHGMADGSFGGTVEAYLAVVHPDDRKPFAEGLRQAIATGHEFSREYRIVWPDFSIHWMDTRAQVHGRADGRATRVLGGAIDITERKVLEGRLRQAQKLDAIGQLAGGVAHDFNNLLTVILGYAEYIVADVSVADEHRRDVREIIKSAERGAGLTRQLLAFSRNQVLQATLVDVNLLVADMSDMLGRLIGEHIELVTVLAPGLGSVLADHGQLEQVLMNLAVNARDAMPDGGRLVIETADVQLDELSGLPEQVVVPGAYVVLAVTDSGTGIDAATRSRLFEPFFTTKERGKGTGLGLATVYGIVQQSGGYIRVYSEPGHGATFKVYLPRSTDEARGETEAVPLAPAAPRGAETVLLVEDEEGVRRLVTRILESAGYRTLVASNPAEARALFAQHPAAIDLLLTDVVMPGASGPDLFQSLAAHAPGLKVLYMSGYTEHAIARSGLNRGLPLVHKPFTAAVLARAVRELLTPGDASPGPAS